MGERLTIDATNLVSSSCFSFKCLNNFKATLFLINLFHIITQTKYEVEKKRKREMFFSITLGRRRENRESGKRYPSSRI